MSSGGILGGVGAVDVRGRNDRVPIGIERGEIGFRFLVDIRFRDTAVGKVLGEHQCHGIERRLHRGTGGVGAGIVDRNCDKGDKRHQRDGKDHRDIALIGPGKAPGRGADTIGNGCIEHGCHRSWVSAAISGFAAKQVVNRT